MTDGCVHSPDRRHGSTKENQAMPSLREVAHDGWLCTYIYIKQQLEILWARSWAAPVRYGKGRWRGPSITYKITPAGSLSSMQPARQAAVLGQPSSLRPHCAECTPHPDFPLWENLLDSTRACLTRLRPLRQRFKWLYGYFGFLCSYKPFKKLNSTLPTKSNMASVVREKINFKAARKFKIFKLNLLILIDLTLCSCIRCLNWYSRSRTSIWPAIQILFPHYVRKVGLYICTIHIYVEIGGRGPVDADKCLGIYLLVVLQSLICLTKVIYNLFWTGVFNSLIWFARSSVYSTKMCRC
jgi:hypothetical protein